MDFATFLIQLLNSVQYGLLLFMLAAGLTLIFGIKPAASMNSSSPYCTLLSNWIRKVAKSTVNHVK